MGATMRDAADRQPKDPRYAPTVLRTQNDAVAPASASLFGGLLRWWWIILLAAMVGAGSSFYFAQQRAPTFRAETTLVVGPAEDLDDPREIVDSLDTLDRRSVVATFAVLPKSRTVRQRAQQQLRLTEPQLASYEVETAVLPDSNVLAVRVDGPDGRVAADFANALAQQAIASAGRIYSVYSMRVLDAASVAPAAEGAAASRNIVAGALAGLLIGLLAALLLETLRKRRTGAAHREAHPTVADTSA